MKFNNCLNRDIFYCDTIIIIGGENVKRKKVVVIIIGFLLVIIILSIIMFQYYLPKPIITDEENAKITTIFIKGGIDENLIDKNALLDILSKYKSKKTLQNYFPYQYNKIKVEINFMDNDKSKHILLGDFNIWYETGDEGAYEILNAEELKDEVWDLVD